jgi:hypothetical protein
MKRHGLGGLSALLGTVLIGLAVVSSASADLYYGAGGGLSVPYDGQVGWSVVGEIGGDIFSKHFRLGGDFQFIDQQRELDLRGVGFGRYDVALRSYEIRALFRFMFNPGKLTPYVGGGGGVSIIDFNHPGLTSELSGLGVPDVLISDSTVGIGAGLLVLAGIEWPIMTKAVNLYGEARAGYTWEVTDNLKGLLTNGSFSGFQAIFGLRMRY